MTVPEGGDGGKPPPLVRRGEDQTLRFRAGRHSYVVYNAWAAPNHDGEGSVDRSGLLVLRNERVVRRMACRSGGDFPENPLFFQLPRDAENLVPQ